MFNKKRLFVFVAFLLLMFFMMTFAGGTPQNQTIATRLVTFIDGLLVLDVRPFAASIVWYKSSAVVTLPTPPGTGVIASTLPSKASKSASPHILPSSLKFIQNLYIMKTVDL